MPVYVRLCPPMSVYVRLCPSMSAYVLSFLDSMRQADIDGRDTPPIKHIITIYNILQENASVDNIVKFLIQQNKIGTGYNAIYTVLDNVCTM